MVDDSLRVALLCIAAIFLTTPVWAPALDVTGNEYEYYAAPVTAEDNRIQVEGYNPGLRDFEGIDCFKEFRESRQCAFEAELLDGAATAGVGPTVEDTNPHTLSVGEQYVAFDATGRVYERTWEQNESSGAYELGLQRANASRVLEEIAGPVGEHDRPIRRAVRAGPTWADEHLEEPQLVTAGEQTYIVYAPYTRSGLSEKPFVERLFELGAIGIGLLLFERTRRMEW